MLCEHHGHEGHKEPEGSWDPHNSPLLVLAEGLLDWVGAVRTSLQGGKLLRSEDSKRSKTTAEDTIGGTYKRSYTGLQTLQHKIQ